MRALSLSCMVYNSKKRGANTPIVVPRQDRNCYRSIIFLDFLPFPYIRPLQTEIVWKYNIPNDTRYKQ